MGRPSKVKQVYAALKRLAGTRGALLTHDEIADAAGVTRPTATRHIDSLEVGGFIEVERPSGYAMTSKYKVLGATHE